MVAADTGGVSVPLFEHPGGGPSTAARAAARSLGAPGALLLLGLRPLGHLLPEVADAKELLEAEVTVPVGVEAVEQLVDHLGPVLEPFPAGLLDERPELVLAQFAVVVGVDPLENGLGVGALSLALSGG